jgi:large-conductance mechanosensitive channel
MAFKEEIIVRTAVGLVLGLAFNNFVASIGKDVLRPLFSRKSFDKLENEFIIDIGGVKINYGDLLGNFLALVTVVVIVYSTLYLVEKNKIL